MITEGQKALGVVTVLATRAVGGILDALGPLVVLLPAEQKSSIIQSVTLAIMNTYMLGLKDPELIYNSIALAIHECAMDEQQFAKDREQVTNIYLEAIRSFDFSAYFSVDSDGDKTINLSQTVIDFGTYFDTLARSKEEASISKRRFGKRRQEVSS